MRSRFISVLLLLCACLLAVEALAALPVSNRDEWMGIYLKGQKIGYSHLVILKGKWGPKIACRRDYSASFRFREGGKKRVASLNSTLHARRDLLPVNAIIEYAMYDANKSDAVDYGKAQFHFAPCRINYAMQVDGETNKGTMPFLRGLNPRSGGVYDLKARKLEVGDKFSIHHLRPAIRFSPTEGITLQYHLVTSRISVTRRETVRVHGKGYNVFVVVDESDGEKITTWIAEDGSTIKEEYPGGITALRESPSEARKGMTGPGPNLPANPKQKAPKPPADSETS